MFRTVSLSIISNTICTASLTFSKSTFCPHSCIYVFCVDLRTNTHYFPIQHKLTGMYNRDGVCLLRGTDWVFKSDRYRFVITGLRQEYMKMLQIYTRIGADVKAGHSNSLKTFGNKLLKRFRASGLN